MQTKIIADLRLDLGHGDHICGSNKIIPVGKRNSQSGQDT